MAKMRRRVRHHVNPLGWPFRGRRAQAISLPDGVEVEVELGCADARFLFERAPVAPDTLHLGLEIREPLVAQVNEQAAELGLPNLQAHFANVNEDLDDLFADRRLARVFVNFPDPWFKQRHHKRRVFTVELRDLLHRKLRPDGELFFQSDVFELALDAMSVLDAHDSPFANLGGPWSFTRDNPYGAKSLREVRCERRGMRIWRLRHAPR